MKQGFRKLAMPLVAVAAFGGGMVASSARADQPYMHAALDQLRAARDTLQRGTPDKGGHRVAAIRAVDAAIAEVKAGIGFDRFH